MIGFSATDHLQTIIQKMNKIVYHIAAQMSDTKDGHAAYHSLSQWHDGDIAKAEKAEELRIKLQELTPSLGMNTMSHINKFLIYLRDLNKFLVWSSLQVMVFLFSM